MRGNLRRMELDPMPVVPKLVSPGWCLNNRDNPDVVIVDVRRLIEYRQAHIPEAVHFPYTGYVRMVGLAFFIPDEASFGGELGRRGIAPWKMVVAYDDYNGRHACRLLYTLELFGYRRLGLLDRQFKSYEGEGYELSSEEPRVTAVEGLDVRLDRERVVTSSKILSLLDADGAVLLDTRAEEELALGHIPGARNLPWFNVVSKDRIFRDVEEIRSVAEGLGIPAHANVITYCDEGTSSVLVMYALRMAGFRKAEAYLASYAEWGSDPTLPKLTSPVPRPRGGAHGGG